MKLRGTLLGPATVAGLAVVVLAVVVLGGEPSDATTRGTNGLIVYQNRNDEQGTGTLYSVRPDGTGRRAITSAPEDASPDWSPDGSKIVFSLAHGQGPLFCSVALVNADGTGLTDLSTGQTGCEGGPVFTPDGQRILFGHFDDKADTVNLWTMDLTGGDRRRLTNRKDSSIESQNISPNGRWITFVRIRSETAKALFRMRSDGTDVSRLTPFRWDVFGSKHDWSPDGKLIVLTRDADRADAGRSANLVTIHPDGSHAKNLTHFKGGTRGAFAGSFAPDGKRIVFRLQKGDKFALATIRRDGSDLRRLTRMTSVMPRFIDWGSHP
jgi:Tol biopolymer transport system component